MDVPGGGSSATFGPDGRQISDDIEQTKEDIIYADLNLDEIPKSKSFLDVVGHYSRPDLLWLVRVGKQTGNIKSADMMYRVWTEERNYTRGRRKLFEFGNVLTTGTDCTV